MSALLAIARQFAARLIANPNFSRSLLTRVPVIRGAATRAVNQPPLFNIPRQVPFFGRTGPTVFSRTLPQPASVTIKNIKQPITLPSGVRITNVKKPFTLSTTTQVPVTGTQRAGMIARSPLRFVANQLSPRELATNLGVTVGLGGIVGAYDVVRNAGSAQSPEAARRDNNQSRNPYTPTQAGPSTAYGAPLAPDTTFNPYTGRVTAPSAVPGQRTPGNQPTTLQPNQPGRVWEAPRNLAPPTTTTPAPPAPTVPTPQDSVNAADENAANLQSEISRIDGVYQGLVNDIKKMYQLAPTEEEKELLRSDLADLEAEHEAAKLAAATLFAEKDQTIKAIASKSRSMTTERAQGVGSLYSNAALDLEALDTARRAQVATENRGTGFGAAVGRDANIDAELLATLAPIAQTYTQNIGDIGAQGIDYLAGLNQAMEAARAGELQSRYAGTRQQIRGDWMQGVTDRIANERLQLASQLGSLAERQLATQASLGRSQSGELSPPTTADIWEAIDTVSAAPGVTDQEFADWMQNYFPGVPVSQLYFDRFRRNRDYIQSEDARRIAAEEAENAMNALSNADLAALEMLRSNPDLWAEIIGAGDID